MHDPGILLQAVKKRLKPNRLVLISIPNGYGWFEFESLLIRIGALKPFMWLALKIRAALRKTQNTTFFNSASGHVQRFSQTSFRQLLHDNGFIVTRFCKGAVSGGDLSGMIVRRIPTLLTFGVKVTDYLPAFLASVWHWEARVRSDVS